jgi:hypothetical protein
MQAKAEQRKESLAQISSRSMSNPHRKPMYQAIEERFV